MEIIRKTNKEKDLTYPGYLIKENGILTINDNLLGNIGLFIRSNKIIYNYNLLQIEGTNPINLNVVYFSDTLDYSSSIETKGFKFNYEQKIEKGTGTNIIYYDGENKKHTFKLIEGTSKYYDEHNPSGLILSLQSDFINNQTKEPYYIEDIQGNKLIFNNNGYLIRIERQTYNNKLTTTITYDENNKIKSISSDNNENITFTYNKTNINSQITINYGSITRSIVATSNYISITKEIKIEIYENENFLINKISKTSKTKTESIIATINNSYYTKRN